MPPDVADKAQRFIAATLQVDMSHHLFNVHVTARPDAHSKYINRLCHLEMKGLCRGFACHYVSPYLTVSYAAPAPCCYGPGVLRQLERLCCSHQRSCKEQELPGG